MEFLHYIASNGYLVLELKLESGQSHLFAVTPGVVKDQRNLEQVRSTITDELWSIIKKERTRC